MENLDYDHRFDSWKFATWNAAKIYISAGVDMANMLTLGVEGTAAKGVEELAKAFIGYFLSTSEYTIGGASVTSLGDWIVSGTLPFDNLGQWAIDLLPLIGTYDAIKGAVEFDSTLKGIFAEY